MNSALKLELQDFHGLPFIASIIWAVLIAACLLALAYYFIKKLFNDNSSKDQVRTGKEERKQRPKGF